MLTMNTSFRHIQGNPRQSWILDSRYLTLDSGRFFVSGTGIPDSSRYCDPDSSNCIPDSKAQDSGF